MSIESPIRVIKRVIFEQIIQMRNDDTNQRLIIVQRLNPVNEIEIEIRTIQSTFNPDIFSATVRIKNLLLIEGTESAQVQIRIVLNEVRPQMQITENLVHFIRLMFYNGNNIQDFVSRIPQIIVRDWNNS